MEKPKIFVRYPPGGSGHFLSLLVSSLFEPVSLLEFSNGHSQVDYINQGHNFNKQWTDEFIANTGKHSNLEQSVNWIKQTFRFKPTSRNFYVVHTHVINPTVLLMSFSNSKLINVTVEEDDINQIVYNFVKKAYYAVNGIPRAKTYLLKIQNDFGKLKWVNPSLLEDGSQLKLLSYVYKHGMIDYFNRYNDVNIDNNVFQIPFKTIANKQLINSLYSIAEYLDIDLNEQRLYNAKQLIEQYSAAQETVPWTLELNTYD